MNFPGDLLMFFFLIPTAKVAQRPDVIARLEQELTARFGGCSHLEGIKVVGLWLPKTGAQPCLDHSSVWCVALKNAPEEFEAFAAILRSKAAELEEEALLITTMSNATIISSDLPVAA